MSRPRDRSSPELDVAEIARRKMDVFGSDARALMLARAKNYRRHGHAKTARFWQVVADAIEAISKSTATE